LDDTAPDLQPPTDRLDVAREAWRELHGHSEPLEQRLSQLTDRCAELLNNWTQVDERHSRAVRDVETRLSEWSAIENRLQQDAVERLRELERNIEHEWKALRQLHEEPVKQLREQAAALGETCVAAANLAIRGFERAEARFAALEADLQRRLTELADNLHATLAEGRAAPKSLGSNVAPFPLDGVMRIHEELREPGSTGSHKTADALVASPALAASDSPASRETPSVSQLSDGALALSTRMESLEREVTNEKEELRETVTRADRLRRDWRLGIGLAAAAGLVAVILAIWLPLHVSAQLNDASTRVAAAERQAQAASDNAARQIASTRADAERQIAEARQTAVKAEIVSNVLAAPDLIRFNLMSQDQSRASAQVLWSRSRGLVVSATRLAPPPPTHVYQVWLVTAVNAISAGVITPDQAGRGTLALDSLSNVVPPVTGALVTLESDGGQSSPTGAIVLARGQQ
jgi:hypothetical protein